jgi:hypothetical protein
MIRRRLVLASVCFVCVLSGCGSDPLGRHAISGSVTLDGAPVDNGSITFQPTEQATTSSGAMIKGGKYSIARDQGLPVGKYRVAISAPKPGTGGDVPPGEMPGETPPAVEMIPPEWNVNSNQTIEVKADGPFEFNFEVVSKK